MSTRIASSENARCATRQPGPSTAWLAIQDYLPADQQQNPPNTPLIRKLEVWPPVRRLEFNTDRRRGTFSTKKSINIAAAFVFVTGDETSLPCSKCAARDGVFSQCIVAPGQVQDDVNGACANCIYQGRTKHCSLLVGFRTSESSIPSCKCSSDINPSNEKGLNKY
jgi:hypothetical protein